MKGARILKYAGGIALGLVALDLLGLAATIWFGAELVQAAQAAGVEGLLPQ